MVQKQNLTNTKKGAIIWMASLFTLMIIVLMSAMPAFIEKQKDYNLLKSLGKIEKLIMLFEGKREEVDEYSRNRFLQEIQSNTIDFYRNTHGLDDYTINLHMRYLEQDINQFYLKPDSKYIGFFWVYANGKEIKRIKSLWLMNYFNENGYFDHSKILEK